MTFDAHDYAAAYGPRTGDRVRLGDTGLVVAGRARRQRTRRGVPGRLRQDRARRHALRAATARESCDVVISNVLLIDAVLGSRKVSIGIRDGRIAGIGRAGNPDTSTASTSSSAPARPSSPARA